MQGKEFHHPFHHQLIMNMNLLHLGPRLGLIFVIKPSYLSGRVGLAEDELATGILCPLMGFLSIISDIPSVTHQLLETKLAELKFWWPKRGVR